MRARLAVQRETPDGARRFRGLWHAFVTMTREGGGVLSLYRGMLPTLLGILPYAGISFTVYETLKETARERAAVAADAGGGGSPELSTISRLLFGGVAGFAGQAATYPLDIVRRRMQTEGYTPLHAHETYPPRRPDPPPGASGVRALLSRLRRTEGGMIDVLSRVYDAEGVRRGLFKGLSLNAIKGPIAVGVSLTTYDTLKRVLHLEGEH